MRETHLTQESVIYNGRSGVALSLVGGFATGRS